MGSDTSIWSKVNAEVLTAPAAQVAVAEAPGGEKPGTKNHSWGLRALDLAGTVLWVYWVTKLFLFDIDVYVINNLFPSAHWILDLRFVIIVIVLAAWAIVTRSWHFLGGLAYLIFFPLIVICWKVPRLVYGRRSWVAAFAVVDVLTNLARDYRFVLISSAVGLLASVLIVVAPSTWLILSAAALWAILLTVLYARALWRSLNPSRFIRSQVILLDRVIDTDAFSNLWSVKAELRSTEVQTFNKAQLAEFTTTMGMGVLTHRLMYWWAYQLDSYRRSPAPFLISALTFLRLFLLAIVTYTLVNDAVFRIDPHAFRYTHQPGWFDFLHYAINTLVAGSADYLSPQASFAIAIADAARLTGLLVLITFFATLLLSIRSTKQDEALRESVTIFRRRAHEFDGRFASQYEVTVAEAMKRLSDLGYGLLGIITFFSSRIPPEFEAGSDLP